MTTKLLIYLFLFLSIGLNAQISTHDNNLISWSTSQDLKPSTIFDLSAHEVPIFDNKAHSFYKIGYLIPFSINLKNNTTNANKLDNGYLWRYEFKADNALAVNLYFEKYQLPQGAKLYIGNKDKSTILGAFTKENNIPDKQFACELIAGSEIYLEYFEPFNAEFEGELVLEGMGYITEGYNISDNSKDYNDSESCQVNVNCSEGNNKPEKEAVVRILVKNNNWLGWCSGTVMNNTLNNCTPYLLTALHCTYDDDGNMASASDFNSWIFYFKYQRSICGNATLEPSTAQTMSGATIKAHSNDGGGEIGSDFLLLLLNNYIPENYNAYYAGWSAESLSLSSTGYSIHHPSGDVKKISSHIAVPLRSSWGGRISFTHLEVQWARTSNGHGTTEGGSSGGPLFNRNGLVIGTLTGGFASCSNLYLKDYFGSMAFHYNQNGTANNRNIKYWLANNTSTTTVQGVAQNNCDILNNINHIPNENLQINIYPNPSTGMINISTEEILFTSIEVYDILGRGILHLFNESSVSNLELDLSNQSNGIYFFKINTEKGQSVKKVILQK